MHSATPKHLHPLLGRRLADWVIEGVRELGPVPLVVVASPDASDAFEGVEVAVQREPRGTGDAAAAARGSLEGFDGDVLVVTGDAATITSDLLGRLVQTHRDEGAAATVLSFESGEPGAYGRVVRGADGTLEAMEATGDRWRVAVQWHPETRVEIGLMAGLVAAAREHAAAGGP